MKLRRPSPALAIALLALSVSMSGVGYAATGELHPRARQCCHVSHAAHRELERQGPSTDARQYRLFFHGAWPQCSRGAGSLHDELNGQGRESERRPARWSGQRRLRAGGRRSHNVPAPHARTWTDGYRLHPPRLLPVGDLRRVGARNPPPLAGYLVRNLSSTYPIDFASSESPGSIYSIGPGDFRGFGTSGAHFETYQVGQSYSLVPEAPRPGRGSQRCGSRSEAAHPVSSRAKNARTGLRIGAGRCGSSPVARPPQATLAFSYLSRLIDKRFVTTGE